MSSVRFFGRVRPNAWYNRTLRQAIEHFAGVLPGSNLTKSQLAEALGLIAEEQSLDEDDGDNTLFALERGRGELPDRRRTVETENTRRIYQLLHRRGSYRTFLWSYIHTPALTRHNEAIVWDTSPAPPQLSQNQSTVSPDTFGRVSHGEVPAVANEALNPTDLPGNIIFSIPGLDPQLALPLQSLEATCVVCMEEIAQVDRPRRRITRACGHEPDVCIPCLRSSIAAQFESKVWDQIDCPSCGARLAYEDIKSFADSSVFGRYDNHSLEACLDGGQFRRCRHEGCQSGQHCYPEDDSYMICRECQGRTCISCDIIWHPDESCAEVAARRAAEASRNAEELATQAYVEGRAKRCPQCEAPGEKISGCDHMTCPRCRYQYCWLCFADYARIRNLGNTQHRNTCYYHSNNLPGAAGHDEWLAANPRGTAAWPV